MATTHTGSSWTQDYYYIGTYGNSSNQRYRFRFAGTLNSIDLVNKKANVTITFTAGASYKGYYWYWYYYEDVFVQKHSSNAVLNPTTRYYTASVGSIGPNDPSSATSSYYNYVQTVPSKNATSPVTNYWDGTFFTWTGDVAYDVNAAGTQATCVLDLYHTCYGDGDDTYVPVNTAKTLRATWTLPALNKITYNANGGTASATEAWVQEGTSTVLPNATHADGSQYNGETYTTSYNANGGSSTPSNQTSYRKYYDTYTLKGWYTAASGGTKAGNGGASYTPTGAIVLYAQWNQNTVLSSTYTTITTASAISRATSGNHDGGTKITTSFNANSGSSTPTSLTSYRQYQTTYTFEKWHVNSTSGTAVAATTTYKPTANTTLYAGWTTSEVAQNTYGTITLPGAISRTSSTATTTIVVSFNYGSGSGTTTSLNSTAQKTTAYTFNGWHEGSASGTSHAATSTWQPTANTTLYAGWSTATSTGNYSSITLPSATAPSNTYFDGWYTAATGGTLIGGSGSNYTPAATTTLYAHYIPTTVASPQTLGIYIKTADGWKEINDFARIKTGTSTWKTYVD